MLAVCILPNVALILIVYLDAIKKYGPFGDTSLGKAFDDGNHWHNKVIGFAVHSGWWIDYL